MFAKTKFPPLSTPFFVGVLLENDGFKRIHKAGLPKKLHFRISVRVYVVCVSNRTLIG